MSASEIDQIIKIVDEEALEIIIDYNAEFKFDHFCPKVQIVYVLELPGSQEPVEYHMLKTLASRVAGVNPRYKIGIIFEDLTQMPVSENDEMVQKEIDRLDREINSPTQSIYRVEVFLISIIECPICSDKKTTKLYKGSCSCGNLSIGTYKPETRCKFKNITTVSYKTAEPIIYEVPSDSEELPQILKSG